MMKLTTPVDLPLTQFEVGYQDNFMLLGSCFAQNMGELLAGAGFRCDLNPFGTLYNPLSIVTALTQIEEGRTYSENDLICYGGQWHSFMHHSSFSSPDPAQCLLDINRRLSAAHEHLGGCTLLVLTLGSAYVYRYRATGEVVGNCHKLPEAQFTRTLLSVEETVAPLSLFLNHLFTLHLQLRVLFTVSPIRHLRDGLTGNQLSKSTLLLAAERLTRQYPGRCFYFPAYEIMMDELRDYRFYDRDLLHPSPVAVEYIWECFSKCYFTPATSAVMQEWMSLKRSWEHRLLAPDSPQSQEFSHKIVLKIEEFCRKYPNFELPNKNL